jgi:internalin A
MTDLEIIKEIEKEVGVNLDLVTRIKWDSIGYSLNKYNQVTGLALYGLSVNFEKVVPFFKKLCNLETLNLSNTSLYDISYLIDLKGIISLNLSFNENIKNYTFLKKIVRLKCLIINSNNLNEVFFLKELKELKELYLSFNDLSNISFLKELNNLKVLDLSFNKPTHLSIISELKGLTYLNLRSNYLTDIFFLKRLKGLTSLNLSTNFLTNVNIIKELKELTYLNLSENELKNVSFLKDNKGLTYLNLSKNNLNNVSFIKELNNLRNLIIYDNPIVNPPVEIANQGIKAIRNYYKQAEEQGTDYIYEAKLMIVGEPGAGKSSLMNKMFDNSYAIPNLEQKSTLGIDIRQNWTFITENNIEFKANIWDFGGQHIQYMLHQFFLTSDCLYILMAEKRRELANFDYWLNILKILGKNSPIIILFNEINLTSASSFIFDEKKYKNLFSELNFIQKDINLSKIEDGRFDTLINEIKEKLKSLEHIGKKVPAKWINIRKELEESRSKKYINIEEYFDICNKYNIVKKEDCLLILNTFHTLGIVLNFYEDPNLRDTIFLDHNWTIDAVYTVLSDKDENIRKKGGVFKRIEVYKLWEAKGYKYLEQTKLLQLMLKDNFELCYKVPECNDEYIVPLLLPKIKPDYLWDEKDNLKFRFQYPFMPDGIISRLIVRLHEYIENQLVWNEGLVLQKNSAKAQIIETKTIKEGVKIIDIRLSGNPNYRKELLLLIREEIRKIQNSSFPNLPYYEMIPCRCHECLNANEPEFYNNKVLENLLFNKKTNKKQCPISGEDVAITNMIDAVYININIYNNKEFENIEKSMRNKIKIFLASSSELKEDREQFEIFINRENKNLNKKGVFIELEIWEDFIDAMSKTRLQDEYNKVIKNCDIFVSLFFTKIGKFTEEEFEKAFGQFKETGRPLVYTYFKNAEVNIQEIKKEDIESKFKFEEKLKLLGHYKTSYKSIEDFKYQFKMQLEKILPDLF